MNKEARTEKKTQACILKFFLDTLTLTSGRVVRSYAENPRKA